LHNPPRDETKAGYGGPAIRHLPRPDGYHRAANYLIDLPYGQETLEATVHYRCRPNGAGKTTFARDYLPDIARLIHFVNVDLIAGGISPLRPELAALATGRLMLRELSRLVEAEAEFAFESTLSGLHYARRIEEWKNKGYLIEIIYIRLASPQLALSRIASRVRQGGHDIPRADVIRRFKRGWTNFLEVYQPLADHWAIYENSESKPKLQERGP
jgi:predicted ABC-type ATPase